MFRSLPGARLPPEGLVKSFAVDFDFPLYFKVIESAVSKRKAEYLAQLLLRSSLFDL
jgi:hypothetical protein